MRWGAAYQFLEADKLLVQFLRKPSQRACSVGVQALRKVNVQSQRSKPAMQG